MSFMATTCSLQATRGYCQGVEPAAILTEQETQQGADNTEVAPEHLSCQPQRTITVDFKAPLALSR